MDLDRSYILFAGGIYINWNIFIIISQNWNLE